VTPARPRQTAASRLSDLLRDRNSAAETGVPLTTAPQPPRAAVVALALIFCVSGALCLFAAVFPVSETAPVRLGSAIGALVLAIGVALLLFGSRLPCWALQAVLATGTLLNSVLVGASTTDYGAALTSFAYIWIGIYAGQFFEQRAVRLHSGLIA